VGWDEKPREPDKILRAIRNLENLLSIKGELVVTLPLGQNPHLDSLLKRGILRFKHQYFMKRVAKSNRWEETKREEVNNIEYDWTIPAANAILIGVTESS
jgi:hypothetical protein